LRRRVIRATPTNQQEGKSDTVPAYAAVTARSYHGGGVNVAMMDGSVPWFIDEVNLGVWRAYSTREPTPTQILRVKRRLESGVLRGKRGTGHDPHWTTTTESVARYRAGQACHKQRPAGPTRERPELRRAYQQLLADYFRSVVLRKRKKGASRRFSPKDNPHGPGSVVRVQYRYLTSRGRAVHTDRRFVVQGSRVIGIESDW